MMDGTPQRDHHRLHDDGGLPRILDFQRFAAARRSAPRQEHVLATTTWNTVDLIDLFLTHYQSLGFTRAFVMDFDSNDGSRDILESARWRSYVTRVPFSGLHSLDSSNILLDAVRTTCGPDAWALFCDPDELLVTPGMHLDVESMTGFDTDVSQIVLPRFNVTAPRSVARLQPSRLNASDALSLRILHRAARLPERDLLADVLEPSWIYTAIPGKVLTRVGSTQTIGPGDHEASLLAGKGIPAPSDMYLLHYPLRSFGEFSQKVAMAAADFAANPDRPPWFGWHQRRWVRLAQAGALYEEYLQQFVPDDELARGLLDGTLQRDDSIVQARTGMKIARAA
jgi:hypothetical protein